MTFSCTRPSASSSPPRKRTDDAAASADRWQGPSWLTRYAVTPDRDRGENVLALRIRYNIISANTPGNNVILAGIEQVVSV